MLYIIISNMFCILEVLHNTGYPCDSGSGNASRPVCVDWPGHHAFPSDDSRLKCFKSV